MITGFGNNVVSALAADITANQTTIQVMPGTGALFSGLLTYDYSNTSNNLQTYAKITLTDAKETVFEICHLTAVNNDILTVIRAQEGTTAKGWSLNDVIGNFATRGSENQFVQIEQLQSGHYISGVAGGTANALTLELPATYFVNGSTDWTLRTPIVVYPTQNNTGAATLQLTMGGRVLGTFKLYKGNKAELVANDILKDVALVCLLDNTQSFFNVSNPGAIYAGLGTAAFCDVTTSRNDNTLGRVLKVGDRNLGVTVILPSTGFDFNTYQFAAGETLFIETNSSINFPSGMPEFANTFVYVNVIGIRDSGNDCALLLSRYDTNISYLAWRIHEANTSINWRVLKIPTAAADIGAIPKDPIGTIGNNGRMASADTPGWWLVSVADAGTVADFPQYPNGNKLYGYGFMFVARSGDVWLQQYFSHTGASASRQTWNGDLSEQIPWVIDYSTANKPTATEVGALPITGGALSGNLGIGTPNALGDNSIALGDNDTGFKQNGDGVLDVYVNNIQVLRFLPGSIESAVSLKVGGSEVATQAWVLQNFVQNIRVSASQERKFWDGAGWSGNDSAFATAIWMVGGSSNVGGLLVRYVQKLINNTWYNVTE
ncbi:hypothetical protein N5D10_11270 [Citrobacter freundii]|uniref:hypothetical protein n=1 Tax=Citrobacter freundii TaxID=546 RepID=UPI00244A58B3|nr:hypothetical protein [Citrobacter freundii]MDH0783795.1 hypothetical protein [Citrobacter freundii]